MRRLDTADGQAVTTLDVLVSEGLDQLGLGQSGSPAHIAGGGRADKPGSGLVAHRGGVQNMVVVGVPNEHLVADWNLGADQRLVALERHEH